MSQSDDNALPVVLGAARGQIYRDLTRDFSTGGPQDLQRTYNGTTGNTPVPAFTDTASLNLGLAAGAGNITGTEAAIGGGLLNLYKGIYKGENVTLGPIFGLRPGNYADVVAGVRLHNEGAFEGSDQRLRNDATPEPTDSNYPAGSTGDAYGRISVPGVAYPAEGPSADKNALVAFLRIGQNALNF